MDLQALPQQQLTESLAIHTIHNLQPPSDTARLSEHIETFIKDVLKHEVTTILAKPTIHTQTMRRDLPFADYFVSSSHNTYLLSNQVLGKSSALSYAHVLSRGARCVEIDVWPSAKGPIVTHGHTLSQSIPFADVCVVIGESVHPHMWPVIVSLECHVYGIEKQEELVQIMRRAWGSKFVDGRLENLNDNVTVEEVMGKILVAVEYYPPPLISLGNDASPPSSGSSSSSESESAAPSSLWPGRRSRVPHHLRISPVLAQVGYYLRSLKPSKNWFSNLFQDPPNIMINISESNMLSLLTNSTTILNNLIIHAQTHFRRIYPKGLRLTSSNLRPYSFWGTGSHVVALNWQRYDLGVQINEAMFVGTPGWVVKPQWMREAIQDRDNSGTQPDRRLKIKGEIVGVCSTPPPSDRDRTADSKPYNAYIKAQLFLPAPEAISLSSLALLTAKVTTELEHCSKAQSVKPLTGDLNFAYPPPDKVDDSSPPAEEQSNLWWRKKREESGFTEMTFEWEIFEKWEDLTFLRLSVCEQEFGIDDTLAVFCARLSDIRRALAEDGVVDNDGASVHGWRAVRLLDMQGKSCGTVALVRFTVTTLEKV